LSWTTAIDDLRAYLSDGPKDKLYYRKKVLNPQNGSNLYFKTFEFRRVTDLSTAVAPEGVFVDDLPVVVTADDPANTGEFTLAVAPTDGQTVRATYFAQWFLDTELAEFLVNAAQWIDLPTYVDMPSGMQPAALEYAASVAYQKLVLRMSVRLSETYQLYDAPDAERFNAVNTYMDISQKKYERALALRNDVYTGRKGQAGAPRTAVAVGYVQQIAPNA